MTFLATSWAHTQLFPFQGNYVTPSLSFQTVARSFSAATPPTLARPAEISTMSLEPRWLLSADSGDESPLSRQPGADENHSQSSELGVEMEELLESVDLEEDLALLKELLFDDHQPAPGQFSSSTHQHY